MQQTRAHAVIATGMMPEVRERPYSQRIDLRILIVTHQWRHELSVNGFSREAVHERRAIRGVPDAGLGIREISHTTALVRRCDSGCCASLLTQPHSRCDLRLDSRGGVVSIIMIEVGLNVLGMVDVAMIAFPIVLPDKLPVRPHKVIDS